MIGLRGICLCLVWIVMTMGACASFAASKDRIRVSDRSPWYWSYRGKPVLLLGGSDEDNLFNHPQLMMDNLEKLVACGGNYIRGTLSCRDEGNVWPYLQTGEKYDLNRFNPEFWRRLEDCCRQCERRGIVVQIEVWATFDYYGDRWKRNPFNPANNVNYTTENTHLVTEWPHHPAGRPQPFFFSPPGRNNDTVVLRYQEAFVRKVLDVTLPYPNVLYCLDNETATPPEWTLYWGKFIQDELRRRGAQASVTQMWDPWDLRHRAHSVTYTHPEFFSFCDVSQNNWMVGQTHYDRLIWFRQNLRKQPGGPRPMNNVKVYGMARPRGKLLPAENVARFWRNIFAGCASTRFHRPPTGLGLNQRAQQTIRAARKFTDAFDIFACEPRPDLLSDTRPDEAYCLADPPRTYAVYMPKGGRVTLQLGNGPGLVLRWFDPSTADFSETQAVKRSERFVLDSPSRDKTWLALLTAR